MGIVKKVKSFVVGDKKCDKQCDNKCDKVCDKK